MPTVDQYESAMSHALEISLNGPETGVNPQVGYEIGMFSLGLPEVSPPTAIATMDIRNGT